MRTGRAAMKAVTWVALAVGVGCASNDTGDKAGNPAPPVTLTLVTTEIQDRPGGDVVERFVAAVDELGGGRIVITPTFDHPADQPPAGDLDNIRALRTGEVDLVLVPARAWHSEGVTTLEPLQLPFVVETDRQADLVAADQELADELLAGLSTIDVTGLGLYPEGLRHLVRLDGTPIDASGDLDGITVRAPTSDTTWAVLDALGAEDVVEVSGSELDVAIRSGDIRAAETSIVLMPSIPSVGRPSLLSNVALYTKFNVLAISDAALAQVDDEVAAVLRDAAAATLAETISDRPREEAALREACSFGVEMVDATEAERELLEARLSSVIEGISAGNDIDALVERVRDVAGDPGQGGGAGCTGSPPPEGAPPAEVADLHPAAGDLPNGTYRFEVDEDTILSSYPNFGRSIEGYSAVFTFVLQDGRFTFEAVNDEGTIRYANIYQVDGDMVTFVFPSGFDFDIPMVVHWRWAMDADGTLSFEPASVDDTGERVDYSDLMTVPDWERLD